MSSLDDVQIMITKGNREEAAKRLISILQTNIENVDAWVLLKKVRKEASQLLIPMLRLNVNDINAWLLLGEVMDDSAKKKECYEQVLKLSPNNLLALNGLSNLESLKKGPLSNKLSDSWKTTGMYIAIFILGIGVIIGLLFFIGSNMKGSLSTRDGSFCGGLMCLGAIAGVSIWFFRGKNQGEVVNAAIREQKQSSSNGSLSETHSSTSKINSNVVLCRACQHTVSRLAPSCPSCGELYPGLISKCPYCGSKTIRITPKGFSVGKAVAGVVLAGPLGATGGLHGRKDLEAKCSSCFRSITINSEEIR